MIKKYWPLPLIFLVALVIFSPVFNLYFLQDDFFILKMGMIGKPQEFFQFFSFQNPHGYLFYRPLTTQVYTFLMQTFFGLRPFFFHLVSFIFFLTNLVLVFKIIEKITGKRNLGFFGSFLYVFNASNLGSLAYLSAFQEVGMAFLFFLSFWLYLKNSKWAIFTFTLALLSKETAIVLPLLLLVYEFLLGKKEWRRTLLFWIILFLYGLLRFSSGLPQTEVYQPVFALNKILNGYAWYFLWGLGLPEMLLDFVGPGLKINPQFILWYRTESQLMFGTAFIFVVFLALAILRAKKEEKRQEAFFLAWFLLALLPVIFFPWHKFAFYLTVPLLGLVGFFVLLLKNLPKLILILAVICLLVVSLTTIKLSQNTYWVITRAKIAKNLVSDLKTQYPQLPQGATLYFENDPEYPLINLIWGNSSTQAFYTLSGANAAQVLYADPTIKAYFEDFDKPPEGEKIFPFTAKISQK